ncbi:MAG: type ISP restriction/modification enzyme [Nitrospirota bacterium]
MKEPKQVSFLIDLAKEGQEAKRIKEKVPILVIFGNPPYSVSSENKSEFIEKLMEDYKEDVRDERNIQPLSDDYIKFIRFAHWKINQAGKGVLGFITNNSYLSGVIHRGMRRKLLDAFDEIYILNLHGSSRIGERTPEGGRDENVFDIQQGVSVALYVKLEKSQKKKKVYYADLWGLRKEKYAYLFENDVITTRWQELEPVSPYYFFIPKDFALQAEYEKFWKVTEIFKEWSSGVKTHRDHFVVGFTREEIKQRMRTFTSNLPYELIRQALDLKDTRDWKLNTAKEKAKKADWKDFIRLYAYRPFDNRYICYLPDLIDRGCDRWDLMKNFFEENIGLVTTRRMPETFGIPAFVCNNIGDIHIIGDQNYFFPLYIYETKRDNPKKSLKTFMLLFEPMAEYHIKKPNISPTLIEQLTKALKKSPTPEQIFYYIYAILYSPTYRKRYEEFLKIDFPRIPLPSNRESFKKLSNLGKELVDLHLLKHPSLDRTEIGFPEGGSNKVEKVVYDEANQRVFLNKKQYFEGVSKEVWEYRIGSYQVMEKYLKDRKGRKLSLDEINHYIKVAKAIRLTVELQEKIDDIYKKQ